MFYRRKWIVAFAVGFGLVMLNPLARAEQPFDITDHFYATVTTLSTSPELTIFQSDVKGIVRDNLENKIFDHLTSHCLRIARISAGKLTGTTFSKFTDSDGDFFITESTSDAVSPAAVESAWKFLQGTGKWKGITGGGKGKFIFMTRGKQQISPTTFQGYLRMTGTYELPKK
jgi:hypothetical protein